MIANLRAEFEVLVWVRDFGAAHARLFPPGSEGARLLAEIATAVDVLTRYAAFTELNALIEKLQRTIPGGRSPSRCGNGAQLDGR
jgi:hypothetical protein